MGMAGRCWFISYQGRLPRRWGPSQAQEGSGSLLKEGRSHSSPGVQGSTLPHSPYTGLYTHTHCPGHWLALRFLLILIRLSCCKQRAFGAPFLRGPRVSPSEHPQRPPSYHWRRNPHTQVPRARPPGARIRCRLVEKAIPAGAKLAGPTGARRWGARGAESWRSRKGPAYPGTPGLVQGSSRSRRTPSPRRCPAPRRPPRPHPGLGLERRGPSYGGHLRVPVPAMDRSDCPRAPRPRTSSLLAVVVLVSVHRDGGPQACSPPQGAPW